MGGHAHASRSPSGVVVTMGPTLPGRATEDVVAGEEGQPDTAQRRYKDRHLMVGPVRLYRDDLERIEELLSQYPDEENWLTPRLRFDTENHWANTLGALLDAEAGATVRRFTVHRHHTPRISVAVKERHTHVTLESNRPEYRGPYEELAELIQARRRRAMAAWLVGWPPLAAALTASGATAWAMARGWDAGSAVALAWLVGTGVAIVTTTLNRRLSSWRGGWSLIHTTPRAETETFWSRHAENLALEAGKLVVYGVVGWLIGRLA